MNSLTQHAGLWWHLTRRDITGRYRGSALGLAWSFATPLLLLAVYTVVFRHVFNARWGGAADDSTAGFALMLFCGLIVHGFFGECLARSPGIVLQHASFVKKVIFPLQILSPMVISSALFHAGMSIAVLLCAVLLVQGALPVTVIALPLVWLPYVVMAVGVSWLLASLGVFLRDISQLMGLLSTVLLFLSPVFYPLSALPPEARRIAYLNPLSFVIEQTRDVVLRGIWPDVAGLVLYLLAALIVAVAGHWWFTKTRKGFADVL